MALGTDPAAKVGNLERLPGISSCDMIQIHKIIAAAVLSSTVLTACGGDNPTGNDSGDTNNSVACDLFSNFVFDGGPGRDGIPALTNPDVAPDSSPDASFLTPDSRVIGVVQNGAARAYPMAVMWWHEIANDTLGGEPILVTYCPLTGSGLAFDPRVGGTTLNFGVSGLLFENNLMMFDRATESLWPQLLYSARCGTSKGAVLNRIPVVETTWGAWLALHPNSTVVTRNTGFVRQYGLYPYGDYDVPTNGRLLFPSSPFSSLRPPKELMLGVTLNSESAAYPFGALSTKGSGSIAVVGDTVGGRPIVVTFDKASQTARAFDARVGTQTLSFVVSASDSTMIEDTGSSSKWTAAGLAVSGPMSGTQLSLIADSYTVFWFAWSIFHPETDLLL